MDLVKISEERSIAALENRERQIASHLVLRFVLILRMDPIFPLLVAQVDCRPGEKTSGQN